MSDPNVLNLLVDLPVDAALLGEALSAITRTGLRGTVELEDPEILVIKVRRAAWGIPVDRIAAVLDEPAAIDDPDEEMSG